MKTQSPPHPQANWTALNPESATLSEMSEVVAQTNLRHVAIIMDGNRRWAENRKLMKSLGHVEGVSALKKLVRYCSDLNLQALTVYAFSTENWSRHADEVNFLMKLFGQVLTKELHELHENRVRLKFIGDLQGLPSELIPILENAERVTANNPGLHFQIATNYGSRQELVSAMKQLASQVAGGTLSPEAITEETISAALYTAQLPEPDLIIRTGGEMRLSNFLLWQSAYAEFYSTPLMWPDFTPQAFNVAVLEYAKRNRRFGGG